MPNPRVWDDRPQSPLEELFLHGAQKYTYPDLAVRSQELVETIHGSFFLDVQGTTPRGPPRACPRAACNRLPHVEGAVSRSTGGMFESMAAAVLACFRRDLTEA